MVFKLLPATVVAIAALAAGSSFALGTPSSADVNSRLDSLIVTNHYPPATAGTPMTRAEVMAQLHDAQSRGTPLIVSNHYPPATANAGAPETRAEVMAQLRDARSHGYSLTNANPFPPETR